MHGRIEQRTIRVASLSCRELDFPGARSIALITRVRENKKTGEKSSETVACISNLLNPSAQEFGAAVRRHWTIENTFFHTRDATMAEDRHTMHIGNGPLNFPLLRSFAISISHLTGARSLPDAETKFQKFAYSFLSVFQVDPLALAA